MVVILPNGDLCEDDEYYGIYYDDEIEEEEEEEEDTTDFIDSNYKEDTIYQWEYRLMLVK